MAMKHPNDPIEPLTLGNMRENGVRSLDVIPPMVTACLWFVAVQYSGRGGLTE
jgi:hypothetical protein